VGTEKPIPYIPHALLLPHSRPKIASPIPYILIYINIYYDLLSIVLSLTKFAILGKNIRKNIECPNPASLLFIYST
ncbi:hypothetical protein, partial [Pantoea brenneri]|uniref:hypothetical protein n=1 Tax=Pantoea brenneri TaxID=472694 RepID=UPI00197EA036